jgi:hemoglobin/transferrin/lactoferrin receptor protein
MPFCLFLFRPLGLSEKYPMPIFTNMNLLPSYFFKRATSWRLLLYFLGVWGCVLPTLWAQDSVNLMFEKERLTKEDLAAVTLSEATKLVSVSRSAKRLDELPVTVYVITHEEIVKNGYVTLVDVLKSVPGIRVSQPGAGDLGEMFMMRGQIGNQYAKILLNNVPLQPSVSGGLPIAAQLPIAQAERIEVIYGPAAAVYGGDAVAGVINIITQKAEKGVFAQANSYFLGRIHIATSILSSAANWGAIETYCSITFMAIAPSVMI